ncbi:hypothetical protein NDU88_008212 [Pleurodeles waltl]|uniref:Uncharacterized protein n=1 Tax=Pleurodeles waltl TaxID=8319 RepID=A0AAV7PRH6_PLEWA|nr:hypothetical protein NDU88_008212 [Pleurodeles waltl]
MAVPSRRDPVLLLPSAQLCRERMMQHFGATLLGHLESDWAHSQTCALRMRLLREAVYEIPFLEEDGIVSFIGPARGAALNGFGALDHTCSMVLCGVDLPILTYIEVEELLRSIASI